MWEKSSHLYADARLFKDEKKLAILFPRQGGEDGRNSSPSFFFLCSLRLSSSLFLFSHVVAHPSS
jgi:hypothetical protein